MSFQQRPVRISNQNDRVRTIAALDGAGMLLCACAALVVILLLNVFSADSDFALLKGVVWEKPVPTLSPSMGR